MGRWQDDTDFAIGNSAQYMLKLRLMNIPTPDQVIWRPGAITYVRADFSRVSDGYASIEWIWDSISSSSLSTLLSFLNGAMSADVYIISDKRDGTKPNPTPSFALFGAKMWKPILSGEEGVPIVRTPYAYQTVKMQFMNALEQWATYPMYAR